MNDTLKNNTMYFPEIQLNNYFPEIPFDNRPGYEGVLTNESPDHNNLRTKSVQGTFRKTPEVGKVFWIFGKPLTEGALTRSVNTSPVKSIKHEMDGVVVFETESGSTYRLDYFQIEEV